jgi:predicted nucleic acid-binding protein
VQAYLDTNILYSYLKKKIEERISGNENEVKFFLFDNAKIAPVSSFFTLAELVEVLRREINLSKKSIEEFIENEVKVLEIRLIDRAKIDDNVFRWHLNGLGLKDAIHLSIAKENNLVLVTNDLNLIKFARMANVESLTLRDLKAKLSNYF